jgi:hypothetical protein
MMISLAALPFAILLFCLGFARSHWITPVALFAASGPAVAAFSWSHDVVRIAALLLLNLSFFYAAFALGHWVASHAGASR